MRLKLINKYNLVMGAVLLATMIMYAFLNVETLTTMFMDDALKDVDNLSETVIRTTHYQMLEDDRQRVYQMIEEVGSQKGVNRIRLLDKEGIINYSTHKDEIGTCVDRNSEGCSGCHSGETPRVQASSMDRSRIFVNREGVELLGVTKEILNKESCYTAQCHFHAPEAQLLGILDVHVDLSSVRATAAAYRNNIIVFTLVLLLILGTCLSLLTHQLINVPVNNLLEHTQKVAQGDLSTRVDNYPRDELGELTEAFNSMTANLKKAQDESREWANTLEAKVEERTQKIQRMQSKLLRSEKLASIGELVAGIAHEINNPLTGVLMFAAMIEDDPRLDPAIKKDLQTIVHETQRCAKIVRELLDFSRESVPQKKKDSVNQVLDKTMALVQHHTSFHNIRISREYNEALPPILIDPSQIEQVFMNVLINASQAMPSGGQLTIKTDFSAQPNHLYVKISDTGCGIPEENLQKIFDPFFSTKGVKGTGLGLSVSYGIIENHGGQIEVTSKTGEGTAFTIRFPLTEASVNSSEQHPESQAS
ncbi:sensor histidine kinase [Trichloromonas sp.]|uniref:sensor histidine kinase n=1 Tax=Trichloromonas sp. TaxID=3069249 RepID=UPI003D816B6F